MNDPPQKGRLRFIRVLDIGGMVWEGAEAYETVEAALQEAEAAIAAWLEENG